MAEIDEMKLQQGLEDDLAKARTMAQQSSQAQGVKREMPVNYEPRAVRIKNRAYAQRELANNSRTFDTAIKDLLAESNITDKIEASKFQSGMKKKLNQAQMRLIKMAQQAQKEMYRRKLNQAQKEQMWANIRKAVKNSASSMVMSGMFSGGGPVRETTGFQQAASGTVGGVSTTYGPDIAIIDPGI